MGDGEPDIDLEHLGEIGVEAARLFEALREAAASWSEESLQETPGEPLREGGHVDPAATAGVTGGAGGAGAEHVATCTWCPLCAAYRRLQRTRPEVVTQLREVAASLSSALAAFAHERPAGGGGAASSRTSGGAASGPWASGAPPQESTPKVERIEVQE